MTGEANHEIFLCLDKDFVSYVRLTQSGQTFTVPKTGSYYLRLDVNNNGATSHFYDLNVHELLGSYKIPHGGTLSEYSNMFNSSWSGTERFIGFNDGTSVSRRNGFYSYRNNPMCYYADSHSDLYNAFSYDRVALNKHYWDHGYSEGRPVVQYAGNTKITSNKTLYAAYVTQP